MTEAPETLRAVPLLLLSALLLILATAAWAQRPPRTARPQARQSRGRKRRLRSGAGLRVVSGPRLPCANVLVVSKTPFDARSWNGFRPVTSTRGRAHESDRVVPRRRSEDRGRPAGLYWAVGSSQTRRTPRVQRDAPRPRCFRSSRTASPRRRSLRVSDRQGDPRRDHRGTPVPAAIHLAAGYTIDPAVGAPSVPGSLREPAAAPNSRRSFLVYYATPIRGGVRGNITASGGMIVSYVPPYVPRAHEGRRRPDARQSGSLGRRYEPPTSLSTLIAQSTTRAHSRRARVRGRRSRVDRTAVVARRRTACEPLEQRHQQAPAHRAAGNATAALAQHPDVAWIECTSSPSCTTSPRSGLLQRPVGKPPDVEPRLNGRGPGDSPFRQRHRHDARAVSTRSRGPGRDLRCLSDAPQGDPVTRTAPLAGRRVRRSPRRLVSRLAHERNRRGQRCDRALSGYDGLAKAAKIWHSDLAGPTWRTALAGGGSERSVPASYRKRGRRRALSSNSWGAPVMACTRLNSLAVDQFMYNHPDYLIFFSNGNRRGDELRGAPATAKNLRERGTARATATGSSVYRRRAAARPSPAPQADRLRAAQIVDVGAERSEHLCGPRGHVDVDPGAAGVAALMRQYCTDGWYPTGAPVPTNASRRRRASQGDGRELGGERCQRLQRPRQHDRPTAASTPTACSTSRATSAAPARRSNRRHRSGPDDRVPGQRRERLDRAEATLVWTDFPAIPRPRRSS